MKFIQKDYSTTVVKEYERELQMQKLDKKSLSNSMTHPEMTGPKLYKLVRDIKVIPHFWDLKKQMYAEQGGICCYCGQKICWKDGRKAAVEHLIPKGVDRTLVGEYENLLLSCSLTSEENESIKEGEISRKDLEHCDAAKRNALLHYTPIQQEIASKFMYDEVGIIHETDSHSMKDIQTLNLNCNALVKRRQAALSILFDEKNEMLSEEEIRAISSAVTQRDSNGMYHEFCFVIHQVGERLLHEAETSKKVK